jgi:hypothetical protein
MADNDDRAEHYTAEDLRRICAEADEWNRKFEQERIDEGNKEIVKELRLALIKKGLDTSLAQGLLPQVAKRSFYDEENIKVRLRDDDGDAVDIATGVQRIVAAYAKSDECRSDVARRQDEAEAKHVIDLLHGAVSDNDPNAGRPMGWAERERDAKAFLDVFNAPPRPMPSPYAPPPKSGFESFSKRQQDAEAQRAEDKALLEIFLGPEK